MKERTIYALGFFDGVHLGHQALLAQCKRLASEHGCRAGVVTFSSHPDSLVSGDAPVLLNTIEDRQRILGAFGMEVIWTLPFDRELMTTHWSAFLSQLVEAGAAGFVCGDDFRFGSGGLGTAKKLAAYCNKRGLPCAVVPQQTWNHTRVSSTHIRKLLEEGKMEEAVEFLGHPHIFTGTVSPGRQLGRTMGIPTANLPLPQGLIVPKKGVYACKAYVDGACYIAVTNVGSRPTVGGHESRAECWLPDFQGDLYGKPLQLHFYKFLREEKKFPDLAALKEEIQKNKEEIFHFFGEK